MTYRETASDLAKKYDHTYVRFKGELVFAHHFSEAGSNPGDSITALLWRKDGEGSKDPTLVVPDDFEPIYFNATFINNTEFRHDVHSPAIPAILVQRKPRRQWKRGICQENTSIKSPIWPLYSAFGRPMPGWQSQLDMALVRRLTNPEYPSIGTALELCKVYQAVAISPMFVVTLSSISQNKYLLASQFGFIGEITNDTIWVKHPPALQEVRDWVVRSKQTRVSVEVA